MMKITNLSLFLVSVSLASAASAQASDPATQRMLGDQEYCYALAAMSNMSVLWRNSGRTMEEQLERRKKSLGSDTPEYLLVQDVTRQIYEKDIKDPKAAIAETHASCLDAKGHTKKFTQKAIRNCPIVGVMVGEVAMARRKGATVEQISVLLADRYGELPKTYEGGLEKLTAKYSENGKPDNGTVDYQLCMALGMTGQ